MEVLQLQSCDGFEDFLSLSDNYDRPDDKNARTEVYIQITEWDKSRVEHEASLAINKKQAVELIAYLTEFYKLGEENETSRGVTTP